MIVTGNPELQSDYSDGGVGIVSQRLLKQGTELVDDTSVWMEGLPEKETDICYTFKGKDGFFRSSSTFTSFMNKRSNGKEEINIQIHIHIINDMPTIVWRVTKQIEQHQELLIENKKIINSDFHMVTTNPSLQWEFRKM